ncbi:MAG: hypothetical protein HY900_15245, partial [Deltaproteobacteria bacterium]|nr:hypothetical protein [Deltaproteobacteria bacterium]
MSKGLLIGLVAVVAVSLLAVAFLLGRSSGTDLSSGTPPQSRVVVRSGPEGRSTEERPEARSVADDSASGLEGQAPASTPGESLPQDLAGSNEGPALASPAAGAPAVAADPTAAAV